jgi:pimeloyl-ACP methyl ester carboxylesterase
LLRTLGALLDVLQLVHSVLTYAVLTPVMFLFIHFCVYPGNIQGDRDLSGRPFLFTASHDGLRIHGYNVSLLAPVAGGKVAPLLFFGGNAQGMTGAAMDAQATFGQLVDADHNFSFQVFTAAYRGYAPNSGWITQQAATSDAEDLLDFVLKSRHEHADGRVFIGGWSMGCAVTLQLAAKRPEAVAGIVLFSPWSTLHHEAMDIARPLTYLAWFWLYTLDVWDSVAAMSSLPADMPVAVVSANSDEVIGPWQHRKVYEAACAGGQTCKDKWWLSTPGVGHTDFDSETNKWKKELLEWAAAAWRRVEVFGAKDASSRSNRTHSEFPYDFKAYDPVGDMVSRFKAIEHKLLVMRGK